MFTEGYSVASRAIIRRVFWVEWLHKTPHVNLTLHPVNSTFAPSSSLYQESLGIIGSVPAAILILTLLILLLYLLTRCCDSKPRKSSSIICLKVFLIIFALLTLGALGVSVWGNEVVHNGVAETLHCLDNVNTIMHSINNQTRLFDEIVRRNLQPQLNLFKESIQKNNIDNTTVQIFLLESLHFMQGNISEVLLINVEDISAKLSGGELSGIVKVVKFGELIRWASTLGTTALLMLGVLVVMIGVARHSRCTLIMFSVFGLLALIVCWGLTSFYLASAVAMSDWCIEPNPYMEYQMGRMVSKDVARYYVRCDPSRPSPFSRYLTHAQQSADQIVTSLGRVTKVANRNYARHEVHPRLDHLGAFMNQSQRILGGIATLLECQAINHQYTMALSASCDTTMTGLVYLLISAAGSGFLFTILVWFTSHTWIYLNGKGEQMCSEEQDPFLPSRQGGSRASTLNSIGGGPLYSRQRLSHTPPQTPPYPGTLNGHAYHGPPPPMVPVAPPPQPIPMGTLGRHQHYHNYPSAPNGGQYATLSKQCKTLESSDFY